MKNERPDRSGPHRVAFEKNKKRILATQEVCGICGKPVDMTLKTPHPLSACIDHIVPVSKGGHPSDIENLQLAHWACNRAKSDKLFKSKREPKKAITNRNLPWSTDWTKYKGA
ncbi:MAG: HNH endonuclease signature motif containing protein [Clostridia bacterium]|nr:HNH endonuclease signature motif containing protein [Clostridia bacterium]